MMGPRPAAWDAVPADGHAEAIFGQLPGCLGEPAFNGGLRVYCSDMLLPPAPPLAAKFMNSWARAELCAQVAASYGAWRQGGVRASLGYLQSLRLESARQTAQHVAVMRRLGLVSLVRDAGDRRRVWLEPTAGMIAAVSLPMLHVVALGDRLADEDCAARLRLDPARLLSVFAKGVAVRERIDGLRITAFPVIEAFARQDGGWRLLLAVIGQHLAGPVSAGGAALSWAALPAILYVSRSQLANLLRMAARGGHFTLKRRRLAAISPGLVEAFRRYVGLQMLHFRAVARALI